MPSPHSHQDPHQDPIATSASEEGDARARGEAWHERTSLLGEIVEPVLAAMGYELAHLEWSGSGRRHRLQVFIDHPDGVDLDDCARLSPLLSNALDAAEASAPEGPLARLLAGAYNLEVSSPGLDRPLSRRSHFSRFLGRRVKVRTFAPLDPTTESNQKNFHGRIVQVEPDPERPEDDRHGMVELVEEGGMHYHIPLTQIRRANLVYEGDA